MKLRKKYKKDFEEIVSDLSSKKVTTKVLSIDLVGVSKVQDNFIYECIFLDNGNVKSVPIIGVDVTQALAKLESYVDLGIPEATLKLMLGSERFQS